MKSKLIYPLRKVVTAQVAFSQQVSERLTHHEASFILELECGHRETRPKTAKNPLPPRNVRCHACDPIHKAVK